ncbi:39S ribosomal protein L30, mitochondrial [Ischnura elegans]|uniref:39S ribosomal protein L30, mitochondrial n=1 Tax=Ischnura elegans TaxID=197161 RepID=UPI001ED873FD|nr:39S ribosomal protein L30, mitochondrial [Ischnura elegans]
MSLLRFSGARVVNAASNQVQCRTLTVSRSSFSRQILEHEKPVECHGFIYYPRFPNQEDPPIQPSKVFMVQRIKPLKGRPYWEKEIMKQYKMDGKRQDVVIIKNIPENNQRLWKVKHLIRITPVVFPNGPPSREDIGGTFLKENGELVVSKRLKIPQECLESKAEKEKLKMDKETIKKQCRLRWLNAWQTW